MVGDTIKHYRILKRLGSGGMGDVYVAENLHLKNKVAIKVLPQHLSRDEDAKRRFRQEAESASALNHPNVCTVHDIDETDEGQLFIAMALYEGQTLKEKLEAGPLPVDEAVGIASQISEGLVAAHERGIIHRDIKPANILITAKGRAVILDFGLAKLQESTMALTASRATMGTVAYMSPEQARGEAVDHRTDIWSLGVVLYEILAGQRPFKADYTAALIYNILNEPAPSLRKLTPTIPGRLAQLVSRCLAKDPDRRPIDIGSVLRQLEACLTGTYPATIQDKARWRRVSVALLAVLGVILTITLVIRIVGQRDVGDSATESASGEQPFVIAVAPFWGVDEVEMKEGTRMQVVVEQKLVEELGGERDARVLGSRTVTFRPRSHTEARNLGDSLEADVVLWGEVLELSGVMEIQPQLTTRSSLNDRAVRHPIGEPGRFQRTIGVPSQSVEALRASTRGPNQLTLRRSKADDVINLALLAAGSYYRSISQRRPEYKVRTHYRKKALEVLGRIDPATSTSLYQQAVVQASLREFSEAEELYLRAIEMDTSNSALRGALGDFYWDRDRLEEAQTAYHEAIALNPQDYWAFQQLGYFEQSQGKYEDAIQTLREGIEHNPQQAVLYLQLIRMLIGQGEYEDAIDIANNALRYDLEDDRVGNYERIALGDWHYQMARCYGGLGQFEEAIAAYLQALATDPDGPARSELQRLYLELGRYDEAESMIVNELRDRPNSPWIFQNLSEVYRRAGRIADADKALVKALELYEPDPRNGLLGSTLYRDLGMLRRERGLLDEAADAFARALEMDDAFAPPLRFDLAWTHYYRGDYQQSLLELRKALESWPHKVGWHLHYAFVLHSRGDTDLAYEYLLQIRDSTDTADPVLNFYLGETSETALREAMARGEVEGRGGALYFLGMAHRLGFGRGVARSAPDPQMARDYFEHSLQVTALPEPIGIPNEVWGSLSRYVPTWLPSGHQYRDLVVFELKRLTTAR